MMTKDEAIAALGGVEKARAFIKRKREPGAQDEWVAVLDLALASLADTPADALREQAVKWREALDHTVGWLESATAPPRRFATAVQKEIDRTIERAKYLLAEMPPSTAKVHISSIGGENTLCGILFAPNVKRTLREAVATCEECKSIAAAGDEAAQPEQPSAAPSGEGDSLLHWFVAHQVNDSPTLGAVVNVVYELARAEIARRAAAKEKR